MKKLVARGVVGEKVGLVKNWSFGENGVFWQGWTLGETRRSFAAADAAIDVFNSLHLGENLCETGNGDPLEGQ